MAAKVARTIDDPDIFVDRMVYALTCDDPGLCKAPYLAAKNVLFPDPREIASIEYYIEHFVWGGLQRTRRRAAVSVRRLRHAQLVRQSRPGSSARAYAEKLANGATALRDLAKEHVWRNYDYPHVVMLYFHMYQIAKMYPELSTYLDAAGYLESRLGDGAGVLHLSRTRSTRGTTTPTSGASTTSWSFSS